VTEPAGSGVPIGTEADRPVVLIVDDERDLADTYARWLDGRYDIRTAYGGHEAIESLGEAVDVVLLDRRMPRITGDEVLERIHERGLDCLVSMLTAVEPDSDLSDLGFDEYLVKPVTRADLVEVVDDLLLRGSMADETREYLALQSAADTMAAHDGGEAATGPPPDAVAATRERAAAAGESPTVQRETAELARLRTLSRLLRAMNRAVVEVDTRDALDQRVCEEFAGVDSYEAAVFGDYTPSYEEFTPTATADGASEADPVTCEDGVLGAALAEGSVRVGDPADGAVGRLRPDEGAANAVVVVPVTYAGTVHGAVVLWADEPVEPSERERAVLGELGTVIGNAVDSLRTKEIVHADRVVKLELEVADRTDVLVDLSAELDCRLGLEGLNRSSAAGIVCYVTVAADADAVVAFCSGHDAVSRCRTVDDRGDDVLLECALAGDSVLLALLEANGDVTEFTVESGRGRVGVEVPQARNLRNVFEEVRETIGDIDLVSKRTTDRDYESVAGFCASLGDELTDRQNAAVEAAFRAGYFDWPRDSTAEEVAEGLGMAPPTFHEHLREAERKLAGIYLEETT
jgi:predicted DNA binding protein/CheY-like chemotaxis protein